MGIFPCCGGGGIEDDVLTKDGHPDPATRPPPPEGISFRASAPTSSTATTGNSNSGTLTSTVTSTALVLASTSSDNNSSQSNSPHTKHQSRKNNTTRTMSHRRDAPEQIGSSLHTSWMELVRENPHVAEEHQLRRAMELSLLDCALVIRNNNNDDASTSYFGSAATATPPHEILGVRPNATRDEIKAAFRQKALQTHPDKGGKMGEFERITVAYRTMMTKSSASPGGSRGDAPSSYYNSTTSTTTALKSSAHWDKELKEHKDLVAELFASHSTNLNDNVTKQARVRQVLGLQHHEAGSSNINERQERIRNSCFYLSLAVSYLTGIGALEVQDDDTMTKKSHDNHHYDHSTDLALIRQAALQLKRTIEGAVLQAHPEWARAGLVGEEVQAFSDFLVYCLEDTRTILPDWAVAIFDETSGFVDVYKGCQYDGQENDNGGANDWVQRAHTLTLRFVPGHYQPLLPRQANKRPNLQEILSTLDQQGVFYVVTDGAA